MSRAAWLRLWASPFSRDVFVLAGGGRALLGGGGGGGGTGAGYSQCAESALGLERSTQSHTVLGAVYEADAMTNVTASVLGKVGRALHLVDGHPLGLLRRRIEAYYAAPRPIYTNPATVLGLLGDAANHAATPTVAPGAAAFRYQVYRDLIPVVSVRDNFDALCFPADHAGRSPSDTYYLNGTHMLRTHTSAHEVALLRRIDGWTGDTPAAGGFVTFGDVYRRDEIDALHYPVFHQMEGVRRYASVEVDALRAAAAVLHGVPVAGECALPVQGGHESAVVHCAVLDLQHEVGGLMRWLFGPDVACHWVPGDFPFTLPSFELEIVHHGRRVELCGCGVLRQEILNAAVQESSPTPVFPPSGLGWAFGFGLERLAMALFDIPDIRLFWSEDVRFLGQFRDVRPEDQVRFVPFSRYPPVMRDLSFWLPDTTAIPHHHAVYEIIREEAGELVEQVALLDAFAHPMSGKRSLCYRITYRSMHRSLTDAEINRVQEAIRAKFARVFGVTLR